MSDPYAFRPGGSLKLKRSADDGDGPAKKKKKSSSKSKKEKMREEPVDPPAVAESSDAPGSGKATPDAEEPVVDGKTAAERKFQETQRKRREEKVKKMATKTHKDRVHEFNSKLEALSEHHDIPKVGPG